MMGPTQSQFGPGPLPAPSDSTADMDSLLAGAGYRVRSSDLPHVAHRLDLLDSHLLGPATSASDSLVQYNPSDLSSWVDSIFPLDDDSSPTTWHHQQQLVVPPPLPPPQHHQLPIVDPHEDHAVRLVHLLVSCADSIQQHGTNDNALSLLDEMRLLLPRVGPSFGIGKVAGHFIDALAHRLSPYLPYAVAYPHSCPSDFEILYHHFYEACPYLKFAHFTANQAILEAFEGHDRVHVVDFNLMHGLQWPALIQALALRPGGPPFLRLTGVGPPSPDGRDPLREVGLRLAELARSVNVRFAFRGVAANRLDDVRPWMLQVADGEAIAVNSVLQLHRLLGKNNSNDADVVPIDSVLGWIAGLKPKIVTVVEQEADHNKPAFLDRFTEALFYYSTVFDSLEGGYNGQQQSGALAEIYLQREICNIVCCEGRDRVERHEPLANWRSRLTRSGLKPVHLGSNAFKQASMLLTLFSGEGYCVEEVDGCLMLGWHSRPLISASAWAAGGDDGSGGGDVEQPPESNVTTISSRFSQYYSDHHQDNSNNNYNNVSSSSSSSNNNSSNKYKQQQV